MGMKIKLKVGISELNAIEDAIKRGKLDSTPDDDEKLLLELLGNIFKKTQGKVAKIRSEIDEYEV